MNNLVTMVITVGLQRDIESGDVGSVVVEMTEENAGKLLLDQEKSSFVADDGALAKLINAYAELIGYQCGWFVRAEFLEEENDDGAET